MSANAPWSVKGIDAKAREVAKDLARRSGLTLGEWLNQMILKGEDVGALISKERDRTAQQRPAAPAYDDEEPYELNTRHAPVYREEPRREAPRREAPVRAAPFSSGALASKDLRRRSIFEERPRYDDGYEPESNELSRVARALENLGSRIELSETRTAGTVRGVSSAVESLLNRFERTEAAQAESQAELQAEFHERLNAQDEAFERLSRHSETQGTLAERLNQAERLIDAQAERLEGLSGHVREERDRLERVERQATSPQALDTVRAVEGALGKLANQLYEGDARTRDTLKDVREDMVGLSHRLAQMETRDPERAAQAVIDKVVAKMAQRLEAAEAQTTGALKTLEQAFGALDGRLNHVEERGDVTDPQQVASLKSLAAELQRKLEDSRAEIFNTLQHQTQASIEQAIGQINDRIEQSEKRQALAVERMGLDVMRVADNLNRRMHEVEDANSSGLTRMGQEINHIAGGIEQRFGRAESSHAQALERLGNEIARISERLGVKLTDSERRTTTMVQGIGEQIDQTTRHTRADLEGRIRQSEERTAKLLEDTRARIDSRLAQVQTQLLQAQAARHDEPQRPAARASENPLPSPFGHRLHDEPEDELEDEPENEIQALDLHSTSFSEMDGGFNSGEAVEPVEDEALELGGHALQPAFADAGFTPDFDPFEEDGIEAEADPFAEVDAARKAEPARPASSFAASRREPRVDHDEYEAPGARDLAIDGEEESAVSNSTRDALAAARAAVRASMNAAEDGNANRSALGGLKPATRQRANTQRRESANGGSTFSQAVKASAVAVGGVAVLAGGIWASMHFEPKVSNTSAETPVAAAVLTPADNANQNQSLLNAQYLEAMKLVEARSPGAVDRLKLVANQGYAPAQEYLGELYSGGTGPVPADKAEAFKWTQKAAEGGVAGAMSNIAMMYYNGFGVPTDHSLTAVWLRRAADRGVIDSAFNLGALYMRGDGVPVNPSEAYKWMLIAAKLGDTKDAATTAAGLKSQLTAAQIAKVHDEVETFQPRTDDAALSSTSAASASASLKSNG